MNFPQQMIIRVNDDDDDDDDDGDDEIIDDRMSLKNDTDRLSQ